MRPLGSHRAADGPVLVALSALGMLVLTWRTWPDPVIDFGQQLYVAWRLAEGDVLYRDVAYLYGPLSPWLNACFFRLFGTSLTTLVLCNLAILALVFVVLWRILREIAGNLAATLGGVTLATVFAFGQQVYYANYNFVCPYVYNLTHGVALALGALWGLGRYDRDRRIGALAATGLAAGLVLLTKAEVGLATLPALALGLAVSLWRSRATLGAKVRHALVFLAGVVLPPILAVLGLARSMPLRAAARGVAETWPAILGRQVDQFLLYRWSMGLVDVEQSVRAMRNNLLLYAVLLLLPIALGLRAPRLARSPWVALGVLAATWGVLTLPLAAWVEPLLGLPVILAVLGVLAFADVVRGRVEHGKLLRLVTVVFALLLLAKMPLFTRTYHYGFALAMPGTLVAIAALVTWLPARIERAGGSARPLLAAGLALWLSFVLVHLETTRDYLAAKTVRVGRGGDAFWADERGVFVNDMLAHVEREVASGRTLTVLPMGLTLNYLSRRASSIPHIYFMPSDMVMYGAERVVERFLATPPDYVALVHHDASEFGARFLGQDYAQALYQAIRSRYHVIARTGDVPLVDERFGIELLERNAPSPDEPVAGRARAR